MDKLEITEYILYYTSDTAEQCIEELTSGYAYKAIKHKKWSHLTH